MHYDDEIVEALCVTAMSLARSLIGAVVACGLAVNAYTSHAGLWVYVAPSASPKQVERIADQLADISRWASLPFASLLDQVGRRIPPSTSIFALSGRDGEDFAYVLQRLAMSGRQVRLAALGRHSADAVIRARALGLRASVVRLEPNWRSADALELVG